jgi:hypothetical protein
MDLARSLGNLQAFDGNSDPKEFTRQFNLQACMFGWNEDAKVNVIPFLLKGKSERVYKSLSVEQKRSISETLMAIERGCVQSLDVLLQAFNTRRPQAGESPSGFANILQDLLIRAVPSMGEQERTESDQATASKASKNEKPKYKPNQTQMNAISAHDSDSSVESNTLSLSVPVGERVIRDSDIRNKRSG